MKPAAMSPANPPRGRVRWKSSWFALAVVALSIAPQPSAAQDAARNCVDINRASAKQLEAIIHIGPARAREIVSLRAKAPFESVDDLARVDGIAAGRLRDIRAEGLACVRPNADGIITAASLPEPSSSNAAKEGCVDINTASQSDLERITQIGPARAQQIISLRSERRFTSVGDLVRVRGIGAARVEQIQAQGLACVR